MSHSIYYFEHWVQGQMAAVVKREAESVAAAVVKLSESFPKGVFKFLREERLVWAGAAYESRPHKEIRDAS